MSESSREVRSAFGYIIGFGFVLVLCAGLQWFVPQRTVAPIASRFLCDGAVRVTPASSTQQSDVLSRVDCMNGVASQDVTNETFLVLCIPCALVVMTGSVLIRKLTSPRPRTHIQRASA